MHDKRLQQRGKENKHHSDQNVMVLKSLEIEILTQVEGHFRSLAKWNR